MTCICLLVVAMAQFSQTNTGELRLTVNDAGGLPLRSAVELVSEANQLRENLETDSNGTLVARRLPFGRYRLTVAHEGFTAVTDIVEIRSALPIDYRVTLALAPVQTQVTVLPEDTLLDPHQVTTAQRIGALTLQQRATALPGRSLPDLVNTQPGWLLEANGVLHPRGSEYQTQYVIDGFPLTDNRSPAFAPEIDADDVHAMRILTGGYPAEYGRKLGGIIEVVTAGASRLGFHGDAVATIGSFGTKIGDTVAAYGWRRSTLSLNGGVASTERYLDPPVEENYTNRGTASHVGIHFERDVTDSDRFGVIGRLGQTNFQVPNERIQHDAGQRQDRNSRESAAQFAYQRILSPSILAEVRGMARELSAGLWSNPASTPIVADQHRGFREVYLRTTVSARAGVHEWKFGGDLNAGNVRERFGYHVTDPTRFDRDTPPAFTFADRQPARERALFVQDQLRFGRLTVSAGIRWDHYRLVVDDSAFSPRVALAWSVPAANLVVRGSYDRAFQTPAVENLLLASSPAVDTLSDDVVRLPIRPSRGDFFEAGVSKALARRMRFDVSAFRRTMSDFADDDVLLNTGVSFPIAFRRAVVSGIEAKLEILHGRAVSGSVSYGHLHGVGELPITGGLFLGDEAATLLASTDRFRVSQDQRHTLRGRVSYQLSPATWTALAASYGSGLPVEFSGDLAEPTAQYGARIVDRVDFDAGRIRPTVSLDASAGRRLYKTSSRALWLQADVRNVTNRLNVINFAGLFSGTALGVPRSVAVRLRADF